MSNPQVAIIDSGGANINSIRFALQRLECAAVFTADWQQIESASHVILPGVGSAGAAMRQLDRLGMTKKIRELQQPVLGICLGMQLLFQGSDEGNVECLSIIPARIAALHPARGLTIPHMGWNQNELVRSHSLVGKIPDGFYSYFVHSFAAPVGPWSLATATHGMRFSSVVSFENFSGIQFHPERSGPVGLQILANFLGLEAGVPV